MKQVIVLLAVVAIFQLSLAAKIKPAQLTCEYLTNPTIVDEKNPRLGWVNNAEDNERGQIQTAWQVRVAGSKESLNNPDLWDSGKTTGNQTARVSYEGKPLKSRQDCWWQVRVWDKDGVASDWSEPAFWHMGILSPSEWQAKWIGAPWQGEEALPKPMNPAAPLPEQLPPPAPMFRKEFSVGKEIDKAVVYVTGLGILNCGSMEKKWAMMCWFRIRPTMANAQSHGAEIYRYPMISEI
jgi:alpha-L-rhamnosidase